MRERGRMETERRSWRIPELRSKVNQACKLPCLSREVRCRCKKKRRAAVPKVLRYTQVSRAGGSQAIGHRLPATAQRSGPNGSGPVGLGLFASQPVWRVAGRLGWKDAPSAASRRTAQAPEASPRQQKARGHWPRCGVHTGLRGLRLATTTATWTPQDPPKVLASLAKEGHQVTKQGPSAGPWRH